MLTRTTPTTDGTAPLPSHRTPLPSPYGWFAVAMSADVRPGQVVTGRLAGREVVVRRTRAGQVAVSSAFCPHLGAHLGKGGTVTADGGLRCPFHGFEFDLQGRCAATPYGPPPRTALLPMLHAREVLGAIMVWHGPDDGEPEWEITDVAVDPAQWLAPRSTTLRFSGHPQEVTENSVDLGHLKVLHGFDAVTVRSKLSTDGPRLRTAYSARLARVPVLGHLDVDFDVHVDGLGYSRVETTLPRLGSMRVRQLVLPTLVDATTVELRLAVSVRYSTSRPSRLASVFARFVQAAVLLRFRSEVVSDIAVWAHKTYLPRPALNSGDGPIGPYRRWAAQFYPQPTAD